MTATTFSPEAEKAIDVIKKLLNLAAKAGTPEEAASAAAKAQELLLKHNLDAATVDGAKPEDGKRETAKVEGGFYNHSRRLWESVAGLNFCMYWTQSYMVEGIKQRHVDGPYSPTVRWKGLVQRKRHALIGRIVNTRSTIAMAEYLEQAIERLLGERLRNTSGHHFSNWAMSFRKGCVATVIEKLDERRRELVDEEELRMKAAERAAQDAASKGHSTSTTMTIAKLASSEYDANVDFYVGEIGYSARKRAERMADRAAAAKRRADEEAAYTAWAAANPEEARAQAEADRRREARNEAKRKGPRWSAGDRDNTDWGAFRAGREAARTISIEPQMGGAGGQAKLGR